MIRCFILFAVTLSAATLVQAQSIHLSTTELYFGEIDAFHDRIAEVALHNETNQPCVILRCEVSDNWSVEFSDKTIAPGQTGHLRFKHIGSKLGPFREKVPIFVGLQGEPLYLMLAGENTFAAQAALPCPTFEETPAGNLPFQVRLVDATSGGSVERGSVTVIQGGRSREFALGRNAQGEFSARGGMAWLQLSAPGMEALDTAIYLSRINRVYTFQLKRDAQAVEVSTAGDETISEPETTSTAPPLVSQTNTNPGFSESEFSPNNLVLLCDVSGSMAKLGRMELLKHSAAGLIDLVRPVDQLALLSYAGEARVLLASREAGTDKALWHEALQNLQAKGNTMGRKGLDAACKMALENFIAGGNNEVIICSDGAFGDDLESVLRTVRRYRRKGLRISALAYSASNFARDNLREVALAGNGQFIAVDSPTDARENLIVGLKKHSRKL